MHKLMKIKQKRKEKAEKEVIPALAGAHGIDFQDKIDKKIKQYSNAASEYHTRGSDKPNINDQFSGVMKKLKKGLQNYRITLGSKPRKPGPKGPRHRTQVEF
jgi:hypothetical protein